MLRLKMSQIALNRAIHSIKVPRLYKSAATVLSKVKEGENVRNIVGKIKHPVSILFRKFKESYSRSYKHIFFIPS